MKDELSKQKQNEPYFVLTARLEARSQFLEFPALLDRVQSFAVRYQRRAIAGITWDSPRLVDIPLENLQTKE